VNSVVQGSIHLGVTMLLKELFQRDFFFPQMSRPLSQIF